MSAGRNLVTGTVIRCSRNSFTVMPDQNGADGLLPAYLPLECHIKGKILKGAEGFYNPLAPGDRVVVEPSPLQVPPDDGSGRPGTGRVVSLEKRRNIFARFNQKGQSPQFLAANVDMALCLCTAASPPFRPRFLDRVILQADAAGIEPLIVCNKRDLGDEDPDVEERLEDFIRIGYTVFRVSAKTGEAIDELAAFIADKCSVMIGQSGVGKSSLINALFPGTNAKTGSLNEKYDRGNHTTVMPVMLEGAGGTRVIDTPGIRRFVPYGTDAADLILHMREFASLAGKCTYGLSCSHRTEPGCKIMEAVDAGVIHEDRYNSFLRIHDELSGKQVYDD